jgi:hypothetical protein
MKNNKTTTKREISLVFIKKLNLNVANEKARIISENLGNQKSIYL